jgi:hypothetical protein
MFSYDLKFNYELLLYILITFKALYKTINIIKPSIYVV